MDKILLLDCTLRDGGYVNNWKFGENNIHKIIQKIIQSGTEIIECGYLSQNAEDNADTAKYNDIESVKKVYVSQKNPNQKYAVMINFGEYPIKKLKPADENSPVIRLAFHKKDIDKAFEYFHNLEKLGYTYFIQPMGIMNYSDEEFIKLVCRSNETSAEAFYIVDSFGVIEHKDFRRLIFLADNNLREDIFLGYHSHNNLQQAYSNSKYMVEQHISHSIIIDASVFGMGRGAGNLNIELFARYLNQNYKKSYDIDPFLEVFDECLKPVFIESFWGYSLPFYLSSIHNCHPNYASYFSEKNTLSVKSTNELLSMISDDDKISFTKERAEKYYQMYQENYIDDSSVLAELQKAVENRCVLILAPGKSLKDNRKEIENFIENENPIILGVSKSAEFYSYDYLFISNEKRITNLRPENVGKRIITSNVKKKTDEDILVNYSSYLVKNNVISDDSTLMLINLLKSIGVKRINIAGFDGFTSNPFENYFIENMSLGTKLDTKTEKNYMKKHEVEKLRELLELNFITESMYN